MNARRKVGVLTLSIVALIFGACSSRARWAPPIPFDSERWQQEKATFDSDTREQMAADLIESRSLIGLTRPEVIKQLGEPDSTDHSVYRALRYCIHEDYGSDIDPVSGSDLVVEFGPDDRVRSIRADDWGL